MKSRSVTILVAAVALAITAANQAGAAEVGDVTSTAPIQPGLVILIILSIVFLTLFMVWMLQSSEKLKEDAAAQQETGKEWLRKHISSLEPEDIEKLIKVGDVEIKPTNGETKGIGAKNLQDCIVVTR